MYIAPPFGPLHANIPIAHMGDDKDGDPMWNIKNAVCDKPGHYRGTVMEEDNLPVNPTRHGSGRFHDVWQPSDGKFGHCPQEETSSFMIGSELME